MKTRNAQIRVLCNDTRKYSKAEGDKWHMYYSKLQPTLLHWYFYLTNHYNTSDTMLDEYLKNNIKENRKA